LPRLLLFEPDIGRRLSLVDALRDRYEIALPEPGSAPVRAVRGTRPHLVLLAMRPGNVHATPRACRAIKSEPHAPKVGIVGRRDGGFSAAQLLAHYQADGVMWGDATPEQLFGWLDDLEQGRQPIADHRDREGVLGRAWRRLKRERGPK